MKKMNESIYETLLKVAKEGGNKARSEALSKYQNDFPIKVILDLVYNPNIKFLLPETDPPYTPVDEAVDAQNVLKADVRRLKYCLTSQMVNSYVLLNVSRCLLRC